MDLINFGLDHVQLLPAALGVPVDLLGAQPCATCGALAGHPGEAGRADDVGVGAAVDRGGGHGVAHRALNGGGLGRDEVGQEFNYTVERSFKRTNGGTCGICG